MKTLKTLLSVFAIAGIFSAGALAQPVGQTVQASAEIISNLATGATNALSFGQILSSATPTIAYNSADAGWAEFTGATVGATMDVTIGYPGTLNTTGTSGTSLTFVADTDAGYHSTDAASPTPASATALASATGGTFTASDNGTGNSDFFILVGGQISDASAGVSGETYTGDITISVTHQ